MTEKRFKLNCEYRRQSLLNSAEYCLYTENIELCNLNRCDKE